MTSKPVLYFLLLLIYIPTFSQMTPKTVTIQDSVFSEYLNRAVALTFVMPHPAPIRPMAVMLVFDGQDFPAIQAEQALNNHMAGQPVLLVGIHANKDRIYEYGTASQPDYALRGNKALQTTSFVISELLPYIKANYQVAADRSQWAVAGFSLGGLMALDLAWRHSEFFSRVGVFSGSFWWRQKALDAGYNDNDRIMHRILRETRSSPRLSFWFQTGTNDETDDRDGDGVIDSIDDTLDLIAELERKGYRWGKDIAYVEVPQGEHNPATWAKVFPQLLEWCFSKQ